MAKLSDIQCILLSNAAQRGDGSLLPPPDSLAAPRDRLAKTIASLLKRGLVEERGTTVAALSWREEGEQRFAAIITDAGRKAIGAEMMVEGAETASPHAAPDPGQATTKSALVLEMLGREQGATLAELVAATAWLPHTTRAAVTGLRKKGHVIQRGDETVYRIGNAA